MGERKRPSRHLVVHLPVFRLERCGYDAREQVVLVGEERSAPRVVALTPAAAARGVRRGMVVSAARAVLPEVGVEHLDREAEVMDLRALAEQLRRFSPAILPLPPDTIAVEMDPRGLGEVREWELVRWVRSRMRTLGHRARVVVAGNLRGARALAIHGNQDRVVPEGELAGILAPLPLAALEPPGDLAERLQDLGLTTVGALLALPAASLVGRYGAWAAGVHQVAWEVVDGADPPPPSEDTPLEVRQDLPFPVDTREPLLFVLNRLLGDLGQRLVERARGVVRLRIELGLEEGGCHLLSLRTGRPTGSRGDLLRLVQRRLEGVHLRGAVTRICLAAEEHAPCVAVQGDLLDARGAVEPLPDLVARLLDSLGAGALGFPRLLDAWRPEHAWAPTGCEGLGVGAPAGEEADLEGDVDRGDEGWRGHDLLRPALLLGEPRPVEVEVVEGELRRVCVEGRWLGVVRVSCAEVLQGDWWEDGFHRVYRVLCLADGRNAWVYEEEGHTFLHGWFDQGIGLPAGTKESVG